MSYFRHIRKLMPQTLLLLGFIVICCVVVHADMADDLAEEMTEEYHSTPLRDPASRTTPPSATPKDFSVTSVKINKKPAPIREIQLISPVHKATYTTGMLTFAWKPKKKMKSKIKYILVIESIDGTKKITKKVTKEQKDLALDIGDYKWQVTTEKGLESSWRHFKIIDMDARTSIRDPSSLESSNDNDDSGFADDEDDAPQKGVSSAKTSAQPLQPPKWVKKISSD